MHLRRRLLAATGVIALAAVPAVALTAGTAAAASDVIVNVNPPNISAAALSVTPGARADLTPKQCLAATHIIACQTPESIRAAYDIPESVKGELAGTGKTIVVVDAFGSPTIQSDLATFSKDFNLGYSGPSESSPTLNVIYPGGTPAWVGTPNQVGWAGETTLDVEWAHAVAPGATIDLVVANTNYGDVLNHAVQYAVDNHLGDVISMSYGIPEAALRGNNGQTEQSAAIFEKARQEGITVFASSGDSGSDNYYGAANFGYPASDPNVTAVGGTNLWKNSGLTVKAGTNASQDETVWGDYQSDNCPLCNASYVDSKGQQHGPYGPFGATGGAPSLVTGKTGSDVAYNASVYTGVLTYTSFPGSSPGYHYYGGTSAGSPQWAAITAVLDQVKGSDLGWINGALAAGDWSGGLNDIVAGSNLTPTFTGGFSATTGYDAPTGYGTPDVSHLMDIVAKG